MVSALTQREQLPELDADFVFRHLAVDTGGKPQDELQAMEGVMPGVSCVGRVLRDAGSAFRR